MTRIFNDPLWEKERPDRLARKAKEGKPVERPAKRPVNPSTRDAADC